MTRAKKSEGRPWSMFVIGASFIAGMVAMSALDQIYSEPPKHVVDPPVQAMATAPPKTPPAPRVAVTQAAGPQVVAPAVIEANPIEDLRHRHLDLPVKGAQKSDIKDMFNEGRDGHRHEAVDILFPRMTPVVAVEDGTVAKFFVSKAGGNTIYVFDPSKTYAYYYAHLEGYADGLKEGDAVERGEVIGYVGTSGNAPPNTPHLHFAIFKLTDQKQWWKGAALDPYQVYK